MNEAKHCEVCERLSTALETSLGPWQGEGSRHEFRHRGLPCILHRGPTGAWCGYVGVPPGHQAHGGHYYTGLLTETEADRLVQDLDVHGGITYTEPCQGHICHVPQPGESDAVWWIGFDCAHLGDVSPRDVGIDSPLGGTYKTKAYVEAETRRLADQLAALATPAPAPTEGA